MNDAVPAQIDQITTDHILGIIVVQAFKVSKLPLFVGRSDQIGNLNIELFIATIADEVDLGIVQLADLDLIATAPLFQLDDIFIQLITVELFALFDDVS